MVVVSGTVLAAGAASAATWDPALTRYPYLTDVTTTSVQVNWADALRNTYGTVTWGQGASCATSSVKGTSLGRTFTVVSTTEYQHSITISGLTPGSTYCYRVLGGSTSTVNLLGTDSSPSFTTLPSSGSYSFLTFGDWGDTSAGPNLEQSKLNALMAKSGASFAIGTGDIAYSTGTQAQYGDLVNTGTSISQVFGPDYWRKPGAVLPYFSTPGNHGRTSTFFQNWPEPKATAETGENYDLVNYPASTALGYSASTGPGVWYAFDVAGTRNYVLTADWSDTNTGTADGAACSKQFADRTCPDYQAEADAHWKPGRAQYEWLKTDLTAHPSGLKLAFFHYPLRSDDSTEPGDVYLQNSVNNPAQAISLEKMLYDNGVKLAFNGHAHIYQRNVAPPMGLVSYVTGGGGAKLASIAKGSTANCSTMDAYGLGWSSTSSSGSSCGAAARPASASKVYHFLKVTVSGTTVTVTPINADGETFDSKTYNFGSDSVAPTVPGSIQSRYVPGTKPYAAVTWTAGDDSGSGVAAYDLYRQDPAASSRAYLATVTPENLSYSDPTALSGVAYVYSVDTRDQAGNVATGTAPAMGAPDTSPPTVPTNVSAVSPGGTSVNLSWTASTDDVGVTGYKVFRNGTQVGPAGGVNATSYSDNTVSPSSTYSYTVRAMDAATNLSAASSAASVTTAGASGSTTTSLTATNDVTLNAAAPDTNAGTATRVIVDGSPVNQTLLKFTVPASCASVQSAQLKMTVGTSTDDNSARGGDVRSAGNTWDEATATYANASAQIGTTVVGSFPASVAVGMDYTVNVSSRVSGPGPVSLALSSTSPDAARYFSKEGTTTVTQRPTLTVSCAETGGGGGDITSPTAPTSLTVTAASSASVNLAWSGATDNVGVTSYDVYRNGALIKGGVASSTYNDTTVSPSTMYSYTIKARDAANNVSGPSPTASVTLASDGGGGVSQTFEPTADTRVQQANPTTNYGTSMTLGADQSSTAQIESFLTFDVAGITGTVSSAKLRLWTTTGATSPSVNGPAVHGVADTSWTEAGLTYANRPPAAAIATANVGALTADMMVEYDVISLVGGNGTVGVALVPDSSDGTSFNSRQGSDARKRPQLVVTAG